MLSLGASVPVPSVLSLHLGKHFLVDLPQLLADASDRHPDVTILLGDYLGHMPQMADVLRDRVAAVR